MRVMSRTRLCRGLDWSHSLFCLTLLLWTRRMSGLADFSNYLSRILASHSAHACDGQPLRLHCPRHSTISIQSAFYGSGGARPCGADPPPRARNHSCSAFTALQKLLSECQSRRDCQLPVNHLLFGKDPCPGTSKYLLVDYKCKPTEHKRHVVCEGGEMILRCKPPRVLNIYAAVYGRGLDQADTCPSHLTRPPPSVSLFFIFTKAPPADLEEPSPKESKRPDRSGAVMSNSLLTYAYIRGKHHPEKAALLFTSSVCVGLLFTLLAVSVRVTCRGRQRIDLGIAPKAHSQAVDCQEEEEEDDDDEDEDEEDDDDDDEWTESCLISATGRKDVYSWEELAYVSEAAERAERIERREMIIQEIWMNAYVNGCSAKL
uniref:SUEL-type lectin domain-containing protein n=1 Tax=Mola mola TaxID=94237 RepID=A0A3Q3W9B3_MOLML